MRKIDEKEFILTTNDAEFEILYDKDNDHLLIVEKGTRYITNQKCKKSSSLSWLYDKNEKLVGVKIEDASKNIRNQIEDYINRLKSGYKVSLEKITTIRNERANDVVSRIVKFKINLVQDVLKRFCERKVRHGFKQYQLLYGGERKEIWFLHFSDELSAEIEPETKFRVFPSFNHIFYPTPAEMRETVMKMVKFTDEVSRSIEVICARARSARRRRELRQIFTEVLRMSGLYSRGIIGNLQIELQRRFSTGVLKPSHFVRLNRLLELSVDLAETRILDYETLNLILWYSYAGWGKET